MEKVWNKKFQIDSANLQSFIPPASFISCQIYIHGNYNKFIFFWLQIKPNYQAKVNCCLNVVLRLPIILSFYLSYLTQRSYGCHAGNKSEFHNSAKLREEEFQENPIINWDAILWVNRPPELWAVQLLLAMVSLTEALLIAYLSYKVRQVSDAARWVDPHFVTKFNIKLTLINHSLFTLFHPIRATFGSKFSPSILFSSLLLQFRFYLP